MISHIPRGSQRAIMNHAGEYKYVSKGCFTETSTSASSADAPLIVFFRYQLWDEGKYYEITL